MRRIVFMMSAILPVIVIAALAPGDRVRAQEPGRAPTAATLRGAPDSRGQVVLGPVALHAGLVVVRARHAAGGFFAADLVTAPAGGSPLTDYDSSYSIINSGGRYDGSVATLLRRDGDYYAVVSAGGNVEFQFEQPSPENVTPVEARIFSGEADGVTPVLALPAGTHTIRVTWQATSRLFAWMYAVDDLGGSIVFDSSDGRFLQETGGPSEASVTLALRRPGLFLFRVNAGSYEPMRDPPTWTVSVE